MCHEDESWYVRFDERRMVAVVEIFDDDDGEDLELEVPCEYIVCDRCHGTGMHGHPDIDGNGITSSEWAEWDQEDREDYHRGVYDVTCSECGGLRVVPQPVESKITDRMRKFFDDQAEAASERAADRRYQRLESGEW